MHWHVIDKRQSSRVRHADDVVPRHAPLDRVDAISYDRVVHVSPSYKPYTLLVGAAQGASRVQALAYLIQERSTVCLRVAEVVQRKIAHGHVARRGGHASCVHVVRAYRYAHFSRSPAQLVQSILRRINPRIRRAADALRKVAAAPACKVNDVATLHAAAGQYCSTADQHVLGCPVSCAQFSALRRRHARNPVVVLYRGHHVYKGMTRW